jgi:hypothetical protein
VSILETELGEALAQNVSVSEDALIVDLADGRTITAPLSWYPRLARGTPGERANYRLIGGGIGMHWPDLEEDISVASLLRGRRSGESQASLLRWLQQRQPDSGKRRFKLTLHKTCYEQGFFNVPVEFDRFIRSSEGPVQLVLRKSRKVEGHINRTANRNGTARIMGGPELRDWFQQNYRLDDVVEVDISDLDSIHLD